MKNLKRLSLFILTVACGLSGYTATVLLGASTDHRIVGAYSASITGAASLKHSLKITNESKWEIHHIYLSVMNDDHWGPDQLGEEVLKRGFSITLTNIPTGDYDLKIVDEDGDECILRDVGIFRNEILVIKDDDLLKCQGYDVP